MAQIQIGAAIETIGLEDSALQQNVSANWKGLSELGDGMKRNFNKMNGLMSQCDCLRSISGDANNKRI